MAEGEEAGSGGGGGGGRGRGADERVVEWGGEDYGWWRGGVGWWEGDCEFKNAAVVGACGGVLVCGVEGEGTGRGGGVTFAGEDDAGPERGVGWGEGHVDAGGGGMF